MTCFSVLLLLFLVCITIFLGVPGIPLYWVIHLIGQHVACFVAQVIRQVYHIVESHNDIIIIFVFYHYRVSFRIFRCFLDGARRERIILCIS